MRKTANNLGRELGSVIEADCTLVHSGYRKVEF